MNRRTDRLIQAEMQRINDDTILYIFIHTLIRNRRRPAKGLKVRKTISSSGPREIIKSPPHFHDACVLKYYLKIRLNFHEKEVIYYQRIRGMVK